MEGVCDLVFVGFDSLAMVLVRPAGIVSEGGNRGGDVGIFRPLESLAWKRRREVPVAVRGVLRLDKIKSPNHYPKPRQHRTLRIEPAWHQRVC